MIGISPKPIHFLSQVNVQKPRILKNYYGSLTSTIFRIHLVIVMLSVLNPSSTHRKEIIKYLKRVREETQGMKVTPTIALERVSELVALDYPVTSPTCSAPPRPANTCVICHEALNSQVVSRLGCDHEFHKECVDQWFATQNHTCPTCRSHQPPIDMFPPLSG